MRRHWIELTLAVLVFLFRMWLRITNNLQESLYNWTEDTLLFLFLLITTDLLISVSIMNFKRSDKRITEYRGIFFKIWAKISYFFDICPNCLFATGFRHSDDYKAQVKMCYNCKLFESDIFPNKNYPIKEEKWYNWRILINRGL